METVNRETPGSVWHCGQGFSPSSTQLTHLRNGIGKMEWGALKGRAPWGVKMPSHCHSLTLDLSLGTGRTRGATGMGGGGRGSTLLGASLYLKRLTLA